MPNRLTPERLWDVPRVGAPVPLPDGQACIVPVTTYPPPKGKAVTRLWLVPLASEPRPLTADGVASTEPAVRPDGGAIAFVRKPGDGAGADHGDVGQIYAMRLDGGEPERLTDLPFGASAPRWLPDGRRIAFLSQVFADAPDLAATADRKKARADDSLDVQATEDRVYRFWDRWLTDGRVHHLFVVDTASGEVLDLTPGSRRWFPLMEVGGAYAISPDGREAAFQAARSEPPHDPLLWGIFTVAIPAAGEAQLAQPVLVSDAGDGSGNARRPIYSPDGRYLVHGYQHENDFYADPTRLILRDRATGDAASVTDPWDRSADGWSFDPEDPATLWLTTEDDGRSVLCTLDMASALADPEGHPPRILAREGAIGAPRVAGGRAFVAHSRLDRPPEVAVLDPGAGALRRITRFAEDALADVAMGAVEEIAFAGHGGATVKMFVVHPPEGAGSAGEVAHAGGGSAKPEGSSAAGAATTTPGTIPPLVHLIHGGPHGAFGDEWHWRWNAQVWAAAGYRVALVNFHGSTGWGDAFTRSILGRWGDQPTADIIAATDLLVARGLAQEGRMAIAGGSYGGYMVSWLAATTADRFACAVNHAGVSDFQTQFASDITQGRERAMGGELWANVDALDRWNPLRHAAGFRTPMLVLHGMKDFRVPHAQGLQIYNVYRARGLPARLVVYPGENHWILSRANSLNWYGEVLGWLDRWLGAVPEGQDQAAVATPAAT